MKQFREFICTVNFRHTFAICILVTYLIITILPFWIGSKELSQQAWVYLSGSQGAITLLLGLAGRRYFEHKSTQDNDTQKGNDTQPIIPTPIGGTGVNNPCGNPNCGVQPKA